MSLRIEGGEIRPLLMTQPRRFRISREKSVGISMPAKFEGESGSKFMVNLAGGWG